jgi:hypothetical protein
VTAAIQAAIAEYGYQLEIAKKMPGTVKVPPMYTYIHSVATQEASSILRARPPVGRLDTQRST